eukprot:4199814-Pyramimonas_sp.AAC.1
MHRGCIGDAGGSCDPICSGLIGRNGPPLMMTFEPALGSLGPRDAQIHLGARLPPGLSMSDVRW